MTRANIDVRIQLLRNGLLIRDLADHEGIPAQKEYKRLAKELTITEKSRLLELIEDISSDKKDYKQTTILHHIL